MFIERDVSVQTVGQLSSVACSARVCVLYVLLRNLPVYTCTRCEAFLSLSQYLESLSLSRLKWFFQTCTDSLLRLAAGSSRRWRKDFCNNQNADDVRREIKLGGTGGSFPQTKLRLNDQWLRFRPAGRVQLGPYRTDPCRVGGMEHRCLGL